MGISSILLSALIAGGALALPAAEPVSFDIRDENITLARRAEAINYNQNYIASGANVQYSPNIAAGSFSINYNTQGDFVVGLGWQPGDANPITYSGSFSASGVGILAVYGWTTNPLVEYYIMEVHDGYQTVGTHKGTVTSDGGTYDIWEHQQVNQPSILGTSTFNQYISIRQSPRTSGTVTVQNHFNAWAQAGLNLGTMNYQVLAVESWSGSGSGQISLSKGTGGGTTTTTPTGPTSTSTAPSSGGTGAAQWGQCGGIGWTGPTTCVSPYTCKYFNAYYSQCQ
ncbi:endo-1,4-beta-xylanase Xyl11B [Talaromyces pinophilus]|uniref:Endo-1,4-beta-xylanase n=2 Tax=Talaromyces pinophilus TaxID=128442 RepID=A0A6N4SLB9_TALPI|nr:Endo-1,4-beta-xylanase B [Talaromyces pinophilus]PCH05933.1 Concanavalin A-like lectin/glucanases superfamily [Penicillium occitanis (nom. inval.)]PCH06925.1 hypothetical protein PENOC_021660 [Penicillium occitanis (nom. inval.)]BAO51920.1 xylanase, glycoside hydrolase family 11 [Talaromyces pinophilus CF-2612]GAM40517.1 endo-1,4-beta-xylanase Xyl11B [Talaromyces pinophilus]